MKIIVIANCMVAGEVVEASDKPLEFPDRIAHQLIAAKKAVLPGNDSAESEQKPKQSKKVAKGAPGGASESSGKPK